MKKNLIVFLTCVLLLLASTSVGFASTEKETTTDNNVKTILENKEIKDLNKLFKKALKGETDLELPPASDGILINKNTGEQKKFKTYKTTQLLKVGKDKNGTITKKYATTAFTVFDLSNNLDNSVSTLSDEGDHSNPPVWDSTHHVRAWSKFYYVNDQTSEGVQTIMVTRAEGGWDIYDNQYTLQDQKVTIVCNGYMEGRVGVSDQIQYEYPEYLSFHFYADNSDWDYIMTTWPHNVGNVTECEVYRGGEHWYLKHDNQL